MSSPDLKKRRDIIFSRFPPGQVPEAADNLRSLDQLAVEAKLDKRAVGVSYELTHHTFQELEERLLDKGYHLDNTLMSKLVRALVYYVEETQLHNLGAPERRLKRTSQQAYVRAWEHRPHGDHDDTPPEWREYK